MDGGDHILTVLTDLVAATAIGLDEACALCWDDIDFTEGTARIDKRAVSGRTGVWVRPVRARKARTVALAPKWVEALQEIRRAADEYLATLPLGDTRIPGSAYVFSPSFPGQAPLDPDSIDGRLRDRR